jgi:PD-(D/E)XK endonuclease
MTNRGIDIKHPKQRGEWAELLFMTRATQHGLCVTKPFGDSAHFDFATEYQGRFLRVQVKSTKYMRFNSYICHVTSTCRPHRANQIDFVAAYVIPADAWYIMPAGAFQRKTQVCLSPHRKTSKYGRYREAWHLLRTTPAKTRAAGAGR